MKLNLHYLYNRVWGAEHIIPVSVRAPLPPLNRTWFILCFRMLSGQTQYTGNFTRSRLLFRLLFYRLLFYRFRPPSVLTRSLLVVILCYTVSSFDRFRVLLGARILRGPGIEKGCVVGESGGRVGTVRTESGGVRLGDGTQLRG